MSANSFYPQLDVRPTPPPNALEEQQRAAALRQSAAQTAQTQAQTQGLQQSNQAQGLALKDEMLRRQLAPQFVQKDENGKITGYDNEGLWNAMAQGGADPLNIQKMRMSQIDLQKNILGLNSAQIDNWDKTHGAIQNQLETVKGVYDKEAAENPPQPAPAPAAPQSSPNPQGVPLAATPPQPYDVNAPTTDIGAAAPGSPVSLGAPAPGAAPTASEGAIQTAALNAPRPIGPKTQQAYQAALINLSRQGIPVQGLPPTLQDGRDIDLAEAEVGSLKQARANAAELAKTAESSTKATQQQAEAESALWKPAGPSTMMNIKTGQVIHGVGTPQEEAFRQYVSRGGDPLNFATDQAAREAANPALQAAKLHDAVAQKSAEQAITDGDPSAAAKLLIDGTVAPSQIISSRKPAFAQQAFSAAAQMQPGWNATKADADFKVASSPAQVAFFGSAKSLTDPGGTLDQLAAAAKDIPANEIPIFNTVADAVKASTGSGPIAKYAALALGVADDYSKVMGGGQGSDTSRTQAMNLIASKQSPEQRAASIEGIRGAVSSQTNSRIGRNPVLKKMYGTETAPANNFFSQFGGQAR